MTPRSPLLLAALLALWGCADLDFRQARHLEDAREFVRAAAAYERFLSRRGDDPRRAEALFRLGRIYADAFGRCERGVPLFEEAARMPASSRAVPEASPAAGAARGSAAGTARRPREDWAAAARRALMACPDYFPLEAGSRWVYVDSLSGGANMRLEIALTRSSAAAEASGAYYAGTKRFRDYRRTYEREDWAVWEKEPGGERAPILRYPYRAGLSWQARRGGKLLRYSIVAEGLAVSVKAGAFTGCIKVKSEPAGEPAWVLDYYCPGVGRAKTTVGVPGGENPNTELARYEPAWEPSRASTGSPAK